MYIYIYHYPVTAVPNRGGDPLSFFLGHPLPGGITIDAFIGIHWDLATFLFKKMVTENSHQHFDVSISDSLWWPIAAGFPEAISAWTWGESVCKYLQSIHGKAIINGTMLHHVGKPGNLKHLETSWNIIYYLQIYIYIHNIFTGFSVSHFFDLLCNEVAVREARAPKWQNRGL